MVLETVKDWRVADAFIFPDEATEAKLDISQSQPALANKS